MFFYMPVKVYCENNCVRAHAKELASFGKKALIVTGKSSAFKNGSIADVESALSEHGVEWTIFNEVEENPSVGIWDSPGARTLSSVSAGALLWMLPKRLL